MELNRNHYFVTGVVVLFLGIQLRAVDSYVLNEPTTRFLAGTPAASQPSGTMAQFMPAFGPAPRKVLHPPEWLGWALISIGSVLILHAMALKKPEAG